MLHKEVLQLLDPVDIDGVNLDDKEVEGAVLDAAMLRAQSLLAEMMPNTSTELLTDWERVLGLPDPCVGELTTLQERRAAVVAKYVERGGQSRAYFIEIAARLGYETSITEFGLFQVGISAVGDALNGDDWLYSWLVSAPEETIREFAVGESAVSDPLRSWGNELLECVIRKLKPAHTEVLFNYGDL